VSPEVAAPDVYDGRLRLERDGDRVRLITRGGYNWADRYPWIVEVARKIRQTHFVLDGEAVVLGLTGDADFDALHSRRTTTRSSSTPSTCWPATATTIASCRCRCASSSCRGC
jgi:ATP-dependent DNA ligase